MTNTIPYDGTGKLGDALATLHGMSPKNHNKLAALIQQARDGLGITSKARRLPDEVKLAIYRYHYERLNPVTETVETISQSTDSAIVEINSQAGNDNAVEIILQSDNVEITPQSNAGQTVEIFSQNDERRIVEINSQYRFNDLVRIAF